MIITLLAHQWKEFWRSRTASRNLIAQMLSGLFALYIFTLSLFLGIFLDTLIAKAFPGQNTVTVFFGFVLYYFFIDIIIRFILQNLPTLSIYPYLSLNISRSTLSRFLNLKSLFSIFNILPLVVFLPFIIKIIGNTFPLLSTVCFIISIVGISVFNHFIILYLKRKSILNSWWMIGVFLVVLAFGLADWFNLFSVKVFNAILFYPYLSVIPIVFAIAAYFTNTQFVLNNLYLDADNRSKKQKTGYDYTWLSRYGSVGELMSLDIKLIIRNKRPRSILIISVLFLGYGFMFFKPEFLYKNNFGAILFGSILITGVFVISYGQFLFSWNSNEFDGLIISNTNIKDYIKSKFRLMQIWSTLAFSISLLYGFINWKIIPILFAGYFFNVGIGAGITGYFATIHYKKLDLAKAASFNYQGTSATQFLYSFVMMLIAFLLYFPLGYFVNPWAGVVTVAITSMACFVLQGRWIDFVCKQFLKNKYKILEGFRER